MRILLASAGSGSRGGGEIFLDYLGRGLSARGHEVVVWLPEHPRMDELATKCARFGDVVRGRYRNTYDHWTRSLATCFNRVTSRRIAREWATLKPDIIHLNKQNLEDGLDLLRAVPCGEAPHLCTIHLTQSAHFLGARSASLRDKIARGALSNYGGAFVVVQEARHRALDEFLARRHRIETILNGVPLMDGSIKISSRKAKRSELGLTEYDFLVLGVGRLVEQKQPLAFLDVVARLHAKLPSMKAIWVGDGNLAEAWNARVAVLNLEKVASNVGWQHDVRPFLAAADLMLHVARFEGFPLALIEAMVCGLPCAVTRELLLEIPFLDDATVLIADDPECLTVQIQEPNRLSNAAVRAHRLAEIHLSIDAMAGRYEQLYKELAAERTMP